MIGRIYTNVDNVSGPCRMFGEFPSVDLRIPLAQGFAARDMTPANITARMCGRFLQARGIAGGGGEQSSSAVQRYICSRRKTGGVRGALVSKKSQTGRVKLWFAAVRRPLPPRG